MGGGLTFTASPATKNGFTMTVGYEPLSWTEPDAGGDREYWEYIYGLRVSSNPNVQNLGSITPQNIGTFKIIDILNTEYGNALVDGSDDNYDYEMTIVASHKCLISFKGRTYRVDTPYNNYYKHESSVDYIYFTDGEKVEITYELL